MNIYRFYFEGCAEYIADSTKEALAMFDNDHFNGSALEPKKIEIDNEVNKNDQIRIFNS